MSRPMGSRPEPGDGRNIDEEVGILEGEAAQQKVDERAALKHGAVPYEVWSGVPSGDGGAPPDKTYYDRPVVKEPVWIWAIPAYFYAGGVAGAAAVLAAAAQSVDGKELRGLVERSRRLSAAMSVAGTGFLIYDLGRPERFLNMLRVFRPTSAMSMGSWALATAASAMVSSALLGRARGPLGAIGDAAGLGAGAVGLPLSGYTAVLLADTAVPLWQETRRTMPTLFVATAISSAAALLEMTSLNYKEEKVVHHFGTIGKIAELAAALALERDAGRVERVARPLRQGSGGSLWRAAKALTAAGIAVSFVGGHSRAARLLSGLLGTAGSIAVRFALFHAGKASARDPRASFEQQRAGHGGAESTGTAAVTGAGDKRP